MKYEVYFKDYLNRINAKLHELLPPEKQYPASIHEAIRYSVFPGGKRFRPVLTLAVCEALGGDMQRALIPAASVEMVHCYSLIHDDLPCMDNDDLRRGKPTCHKKYGEASALLAGDALLTLAFQVLADFPDIPTVRLLLREISMASGTYGMIGGQMADIENQGGDVPLPMLDFISIHKTGKLIKVSAVAGALAAGADAESLRHVEKYGESIGLSFQLIDDLIDEDGFVRHQEPKNIRQRVRDLIALAKREIHPFGTRAEKMHHLADFLLERMPQSEHA